jgi:hypothetical protein
MQHDLKRSYEGVLGWNQVAPLSGQERIENLSNPIESKEPHEEEVIGKPLCELIFEMEAVIKPPGKESEQRPVSDSNAIDVVRVKSFVLRVGPIDENA